MSIIQLLASLSFLFVTFAMNPFLITCKDAAVVDLQGQPLLLNNSYYIMSMSGDILGGIGLTVGFTPEVTNSNGIVDESSNYLIQFHSQGDARTYQWNVDLKDEKTGNYYLFVDMDGNKVKDDWFQIVKSDSEKSYKIMYCLGKSCKPIGVYIVNGEYRLALNDQTSYWPLSIVFSESLEAMNKSIM